METLAAARMLINLCLISNITLAYEPGCTTRMIPYLYIIYLYLKKSDT